LLRSLDLSGNPIGDYTFLTGLTNLETLLLRNGSLADVSLLTNMTRLSSLVLYSNAVTDLSPITNLTTLSYVDVRINQIANHTVLGMLTNLTRLCFGWNYAVTNVSFVQSLGRLTWLDFGYSQVSDLTPLSNLSNLTYLVLSGNPATNYGVLSNLKGLANLELHGNSVTNASFLTSLTRLQYADLYKSVTNLPALGQLTNLNSLVLGGVGAYNGLTNLNLTNLWLFQSSVSNAAFFTNLSRLRFLDLSDNSIADPLPLKALTNLAGLGFSGNAGLNYAALATFTNLTMLSLDRDSITNLTTFAPNLTRLNFLSARQNRIPDFSPLPGMSNPASFYLDQNLVTSAQALSNLPSLYWAELTRNLLDTNATSQAMAQLQTLSGRGAKVSYIPQNQRPSISMVSNWLAATNASASISFFISDDLTSSDRLVIATNSSNSGLIANANILVSGTNENRTLTLIPTANQTGTSLITVMVTDEAGLSTNASVSVTVIVPRTVTIPDPNLEAAIRTRLNKPTGDLNNVDLASMSDLFAFSAQITNLSGLEWATNLSALYLGGNVISDLTPLQGLNHLSYLTLDNNHISSLSSLNGLIGLNYLSLQRNRLTDLASLLNLPQLTLVDVTLNLLDLSYGSTAVTEIFNLEARDVSVQFDPQRTPPVIIASPAWTIPANSTSFLSFIVSNNATPGDQFVVTAASSNQTLLPSANILPSFYSNLDWVIAVTPTLNQTGVTTILLTATDDAGLTAGAAVLATVFSPLPVDGGLFDNTNFTWTIGGNTPWFGETFITHSGISAAQSGVIGDGQESWLETTVAGPGPLTYWWKISSETNYDFLEFYVNGALQSNSISGEVDWQQQTMILPPGSQTLRWRYTKDKDTNVGMDAAWLDDVSFISVCWLELAGAPTNGQCYLLIHGAQDKMFEVQCSTNLMDWSSLGVVTMTNTTMPFVDTAAGPGPKYYRLLELPNNSVRLDSPKSGANGFEWVLHSSPGLRFEVQASTNLTNWSPLGIITNTLGSATYIDHLVTNFSTRFYRAKQVL
jgi:internalin A